MSIIADAVEDVDAVDLRLGVAGERGIDLRAVMPLRISGFWTGTRGTTGRPVAQPIEPNPGSSLGVGERGWAQAN